MSKIEYYTPPKYTTVCRYSTTNRILDEDRNLYFETYNNYIVPETVSDTFYSVTERSKNRLDIVSAEVYGYPTYWWVIAMANNIIDPLDVPVDTKLRIPQLTSLYLEGAVFNV